MIKRLNDIPVYSTTQITIEAAVFNTIRLATQRLPLPIRLSLPRYQYIDIIIDHNAWACVDRSLNDLPVIAWTDFEIAQRSALHLPIACKLSNYHLQSAQITEGALTFTKMALEKLSADQLSEEHCQAPLATISRLYCRLPRCAS